MQTYLIPDIIHITELAPCKYLILYVQIPAFQVCAAFFPTT